MLNLVRIWILLSTVMVAAGWLLSAIHQLNRIGYGVVFVIAGIALFFGRRFTGWRTSPKPVRCFYPLRRRWHRPAPLIFLALALLTLLAGWLYSPSNGSSTAYRIPRVMHWLAAGQWHWIRTSDVRMNIAGCGMEWLFAPLILFTHTDRFLFLINWIPFLLLPGLIFSCFIRLGVRPRVAWWWMWLLPTGWCFIMQAGSTLNDSFATVYALAAVDFALRARANKRAGDLWLALLAAGLATGVKQTDILLAIPALIAIWPCERLLLRRPIPSLVIITVCLLISAIPMVVINLQYTGNWTGVTRTSWGKAELHSPVWGLIGNAFCLTAQNLKPPIFPFVHSWNAAMGHFLKTSFGSHFAGFEDFGRLSMGISETNATLGAGIVLFLVLSLWAGWHYRLTSSDVITTKSPDRVLPLLRWMPWALLLVYMAKVGTFENGRQFAAYYIFLFPSLLISSGQSGLIRRRWWQMMAWLVMLVAVLLLVISRDRPLFPSHWVVGRLEAKYPHSNFITSIAATYAGATDFEKQRSFLMNHLPPDEAVIGYAADGGLAESSLWLPFGQRRIERIMPGDTLERLRASGIHYVVIEDSWLRRANDALPQWLARFNGILINQWEFLGDPHEPPQRFYLVRLQAP